MTTSSINRYQALLDIARSLGRVMELNTLLDEILRRSQEVMGAEACSIFIPDRQTGELIISSARGPEGSANPSLSATRIPKGVGISGSVFSSKKTVNIHDVTNDPRYYSKVAEKTGFATRNMIAVPLLSNANECIGVFQALNAIGRDHFNEQDEAVGEAFSGLIVSAMLRIEAQQREIEAVRTKQELELAKEIQQTFLPPPLVVYPTCRIRMTYTAAKHVGGDFCFTHLCSNNRILLGLGDVSGKGVPAALNMARATATIKALVPFLDTDLGNWVTTLNQQLSSDLHAGRFIGITFLLADPEQETVQICSAGQFPPILSNGVEWSQPSCTTQLPLGILPSFQYMSNLFPLKRGHLWMLFSDGITEARNQAGEELTLEGFMKSLKTCRCPAEVFHSAEETWKNFAGDAPQHDDASMLLLDWRGKVPPSELKLTCHPATLTCGREFIEQWALYSGFDDVTAGQIVMGFDEAVTNVYKHSYKGSPGPVSFRAEVANHELIISIHDDAPPVDPSKIKGRELDDLRPGGLGTVVLHCVFEHVEYIPQASGNCLLLKKKIPKSECCEASS